MNVYPFIEAEKAQQRTVKRACELLKVSRAAYYAARRNQPCTRARQDAELAAEIAAVHADSKGRYGAPRIHAIAGYLRTELVADALANAVAARDPEPGVIFRSDRSCQYTSAAYAALADDNQVTLSAGRTGQCWDNALAESFFSTLKGELIDTRTGPTKAGARRAVVEYIAWYNGTRLHSSLDYQSPADYEDNHPENIRQVARPLVTFPWAPHCSAGPGIRAVIGPSTR